MTAVRKTVFPGTIHIIDDDVYLVTALTTLLRQIGAASVENFSSGDAFIAQLPMVAGGCVLLDLNMPGASGLDVLRASQARFQDLAFIVLSGADHVASAVTAMKLGAIDYLEKPPQLAQLQQRIGQAFDHLARNAERNRVGDAARARLNRLSPREHDVLRRLLEGKPHKIIAHELELSFRTIEIYRAKMMEKLGVHSLPDALRIAYDAGLQDSESRPLDSDANI